MKKFTFLLILVGFFAVSAFAQTPNFAGEWKLDTSKLEEQRAALIESQTISIEQTAMEVKATTATVRKAGGGQTGGTTIFKLDGSEVVTERDTPMGTIPTKTTAKIKDGKLEIFSSTTYEGPSGEMTAFSKSTWELSADVNTLTVKQTRSAPDGEVTTESVYTRKS